MRNFKIKVILLQEENATKSVKYIIKDLHTVLSNTPILQCTV